MTVSIYCDGASEPHKPQDGVATYGWHLSGPEFAGEEDYGVVCRGEMATNNVAEYTAIIRALEFLLGRGYTGPITVHSDSQLVIRQLEGRYQVNSEHLKPLNLRAFRLLCKFSNFTLKWIPREQNKRADALSQKACAEHYRGLI